MIDEQLQSLRPGCKILVSVDEFGRLHIMVGHSQIDAAEALLRANRVDFNTTRQGIPFCSVEIVGDANEAHVQAILDRTK